MSSFTARRSPPLAARPGRDPRRSPGTARLRELACRLHARRGRVDLAGFWARRARRLLPAVLVLVTACALMTKHNVPVSEFQARRGDMLATVFYYANWHFIAASESYFALFVGRSPLEHTWSLAIEEQIYVLWPVL